MFPSPRDPGSFCQKCRLAPPESWKAEKLAGLGSARFHFLENWPLNRLLPLGILGFATSREVAKRTISTLPATTLAQPCGSRKTAVFRVFLPFRHFLDIQGALAYDSDRTGQDGSWPVAQPGSWIRGSRQPGSGVWPARIRVPAAPDPGPPGPSGPWIRPSGPSRSPCPGQPRLAWTWIVSNTSPGSPGGDPGDRTRSTEDTRTRAVKLSSRTTSPGRPWAP